MGKPRTFDERKTRPAARHAPKYPRRAVQYPTHQHDWTRAIAPVARMEIEEIEVEATNYQMT